ncbi:MAG: hypothetical protein DRI48_11010, partial [Chloroflexi bacterium]
MKTWSHPGGKLRELGADALTDAELLAILISTGVRGKPALAIAEEVLERFGPLTEMSNLPL